jgi:NAD(P)-dependent dehydrogenase (short-subunit alcohol dehydrogenase family)
MASDDKQGIVWVAGVGASAGLGAALARRFAREGLLAAVTGRTAARVEAVASEIVKSGGKAVALPGDVSSEASIQGIAKKLAELGQLEVAIFNAGNQVRAPSLELTVQQLEEAWRINTLGGFVFSREALRLLVPRQRGSLLVTGATGSLRGKPPFGAFAAAKAGLRSLAQTFAREFGPQGVHVAHVVIDGGIDGERVRNAAPQWVASVGQDGLLGLDAIADTYWHLHTQHRSAWTHELDLRPYKETF